MDKTVSRRPLSKTSAQRCLFCSVLLALSVTVKTFYVAAAPIAATCPQRCMQFSIVIATYNRRRLLDRAIASAFGQTHACEVVVVDDCSSDDTPDWVEQLRHSLPPDQRDRFVYLRNSHNLGHSVSVNRGVEAARGSWIKLLDDDDYLHQDCLAEFARAIQTHAQRFRDGLRPPAALCSCQALQVDLQGHELGRTPRTGPGQAYFIPQEDVHYGMLVELVPFGTPVQVAFRREAFLQARGWNSQFDTNFDDIDAWIRIAQYGDAIFLNQCLAFRTIWDGAYNQQFSFDLRLDTNWSIKQKIHGLVNERFQQQMPQRQTMHSYLRLHWGMVALKHRQWVKALKIAGPGLWSLRGWSMMLATRLNRYRQALAWTYRDTQRYLKRQLQIWLRTRSPHSLLRGGWLNLRWQQTRLRLQLAGQLWHRGMLWAAVLMWQAAIVRGMLALVLDPLARWAQRSPQRRAWALRWTVEFWGLLDRDLSWVSRFRQSLVPPLPAYRSRPRRAMPQRMTTGLRQWIDRLRLFQARQLWQQGAYRQAVRVFLPLLARPIAWRWLWSICWPRSRRPLVRRFVLLEMPLPPSDSVSSSR